MILKLERHSIFCDKLYNGSYMLYSSLNSDLNNTFERYDHLLHQSLREIFLQRCFTRNQTKQLIHDQKLIIELILDQEPLLCNQFPKNNCEQLSLLWIAVLSGYYKSAELLVCSGADVNEPFGSRDPQMVDNKWTILHVLLQMQSSSESERLVHLIIDHGADWQTRDSYGRTILHFAAKHNRVQLTNTLLEKGAEVNLADKGGETPLLLAASSKKANELLPLLMKHGADFTAKSSRNDNILHRLAFNSEDYAAHLALAKILIEKGVSLEDREVQNQYQPIHRAVMSGNNEFLKLCLASGIDVNSRTSNGESPLYLVIRCHITSRAVLETLLSHGASIHLRTCEGRTALHCACEKLKEEIIWLLLSAGADILAEDNNGNTPFSLIDRQIFDNRMKIDEDLSIRLMIKQLALKRTSSSIALKDEIIIRRHWKLWDYYKDCVLYASRMKFTRFMKNCTFFDLLAKNRRQIVALIRRPQFEANFRFYDLNGFGMYAEDIRVAFERGIFVLEMEEIIDNAGGFWPWMIVRSIAGHVPDDYGMNMRSIWNERKGSVTKTKEEDRLSRLLGVS
ncbi:serine/threonine-protein phosphatase 6 regulatory ankyrin repeat subunit A-like [Nasonia vitripennis]|uniref:Uncharacterized protein n=1 Tax=Nasonia vitripennis TaxID=7425 RepID=A0A7M7PYD7_NASVI|nr:serine/threonine-protein phosphatase 6 regulatory ankyrin repeat subunit A-like [Nasonia vitripennis]